VVSVSGASHHPSGGLTSAGIFAGIGGIERGLRSSGIETRFLCELDGDALEVLEARFPESILQRDIRCLKKLPRVDIVSAGFPCQDLSQAGRTEGIGGSQSGLIEHLFDLVRNAKPRPAWIVLENVPFMLFLHGGNAIGYLLSSLEELGYTWAYRLIDSHCFGIPQRRKRVIVMASRQGDPRAVLLSEDAGEREAQPLSKPWCGFYWTEGNSGTGWAVNAVPPLKGGSRVGIPSPPAIWVPQAGRIVTLDIRDAERLQGFPPDWTKPTGASFRDRVRWKMVGNAVCVPLARWLGTRIQRPLDYDSGSDEPLDEARIWPKAAWGHKGERFVSSVSAWPVHKTTKTLGEFLKFPCQDLSVRAASGFYSRVKASNLRLDPRFLEDLRAHIEYQKSRDPSRQHELSA